MCSYWLRTWRPIKKTPYVIFYCLSFKIILWMLILCGYILFQLYGYVYSNFASSVMPQTYFIVQKIKSTTPKSIFSRKQRMALQNSLKFCTLLVHVVRNGIQELHKVICVLFLVFHTRMLS